MGQDGIAISEMGDAMIMTDGKILACCKSEQQRGFAPIKVLDVDHIEGTIDFGDDSASDYSDDDEFIADEYSIRDDDSSDDDDEVSESSDSDDSEDSTDDDDQESSVDSDFEGSQGD